MPVGVGERETSFLNRVKESVPKCGIIRYVFDPNLINDKYGTGLENKNTPECKKMCLE